MKVTLIIPMYNESSIINEAIDTFYGYMKEHFGDWELIFVDDGSVDGCGKAVEAKSADDSRVRLISYTPNMGKGCAVRTGMLASTGDIVIFTDCDNAYGTDVIEKMVKQFEESDFDVILGSRNISADGYDGYTFIRKLASKTYLKVLSIAAGFKYSDSQCGFKGYRGEAARRIFRNCEVNRFAFDLEATMIAQRLGYKIGEMGVKVINHRESKVNVLRDTPKMLADVRRMKKNVKNKTLV